MEWAGFLPDLPPHGMLIDLVFSFGERRRGRSADREKAIKTKDTPKELSTF